MCPQEEKSVSSPEKKKKANIYCSACPNNYLYSIKLNAVSKDEMYYVYYNFFN